ncbi:hypothetical protein NUU61_009191 [Penicillium alfredii]|uniref:Uncharacterized protein n=1 Tax=Penicillium alfredii TaxID=1506179 RepID=A0A9W9EMK0_9EURO|nr:uncharacterized protein NUU61_009191 [Penicillium alfredii]KAJ5084612.1 hypothetical protein NUU61_009191 [Penicillium alfredii]
MSDVEAASLPAALDVGHNTLAAVRPDSAGPPSPGKAPKTDPPSRESSHGPTQHARSEEDGPPSPRADSEAETIIQSGRESLSPEKKRKHIKHDPQRLAIDGVDGNKRKKPRVEDEGARGSRSPSPLERVGSPSASVVKIEKVDDPHSITDGRDVPEEGAGQVERPRGYRKRSFSDSVDEQRERRRADSQASIVPPRDLKHPNHTHFSQPTSNTRSLSPNRPSHQRTASGSQFPTKKKAPTPLTGFQRHGSEDRQSTSSSASGSPLPGAHLRRLGSGAGASASPAKQMGPKKLRDKMVMRHAERPGDLNIPDNAGNTPLQIAALNGETSIVKFLLDAGCEINTKNIDKDTPLIDAVENGNADVVKVLLDAGANPRTVNAEGDEPYELVPSFVDDEEYEEMKKALADAKATSRPGRRSEEQNGSDSREPRSRRPPPMGASNRRKTVRSEATRNDLLWTKPTFENLREFAAKGDEAGVVSILNILQKADNASLIAAAKGGHHDVLSLLYAMGNADADPNPLRGAGHKSGYNTPMLAAIGRGNTGVIQLILNQPGFNPTRRLFEDRTYFELSRARQGENWEEEHDVLKAAYQNYAGPDKGRKDGFSSPRRPRVKGKDDKRPARRRSSSPAARPRKRPDSPNANRPRDSLKDIDALKEKRREKERLNAINSRAKASPKDTSDNALASSDHDSARPDSSKPSTTLTARRDSESSGVARNDDGRKRRLIAGRRPQDRDRRSSLFSSDSLSGREEAPKSRADMAPDSISSLKRIRTDTSPERSRSRGADSDRLSPETRKKKRRVFSDERPSGINGSARNSDDAPDGHKPQPRQTHEESSRPAETIPRKSTTEPSKKSTVRQQSPDLPAKKNGDVKSESQGPDPNPHLVDDNAKDEKRVEKDTEERRRAEAKKDEEERATEEKRVAAEAERARIAKEEADQAARVAREKAEDERKRKEGEQRRAKQAEDERQKRLEQERARVAKMRRDQEAQEQRRRDALPSRLRVAANLVGSNDSRARNHTWLKNFMPMVTALTRQLEPGCAVDVADEKWIPNYLVAPLLATNDLQLSQYASWEKRKATPTQRMNLWRVTRRMLIQADDREFYDASIGEIMQKDCDTRPKYFEMEHVFWIRLSDFMDLVPHIPHLNGLEFQFLSMHIDQEPVPGTFGSLQPNGHAPETNGSTFLNGFGPSRSSTYV